MGRGRRAKGEWVVRVAAGELNGPRSRVLRVASREGTSDVYVTFEVTDAKMSLHDPADSVERPPWQIGLTREAAEKPGALRPPERRAAAAWGPMGRMPDEMVCAAQFIAPGTELRTRSGFKLHTDKDVHWLGPIPTDEAAFIGVYFAPGGGRESIFRAPYGSRLVGSSRRLSNGREVFVMAAVGSLIPEGWEILRAKKAEGERLLLGDIAGGREDGLDPGANPFDGYAKLPYTGVQSFMELEFTRFELVQGGKGSPP